MDQNQPVNHPIYQRATSEDADACSWAFTSKDKFEKYYYKFQPMEENHVRSRVLYTALCQSDVLTGREEWGPCLNPLCPGHEVIGEVIETGTKVSKFKKGDIVGYSPFRDSCKNCDQCLNGFNNLCTEMDGTFKFLYGLFFGGYSTHIQQPDTCVVKIPDGMDLKNTSPLLCAGITVFAPLNKFVKPGMTVGVIGVGGLGHLAIQFASKLGASVYGFTSSKNKESFIKQMGAEAAVLWREKDYQKNYTNKFDILINTLPIANTREEFSSFCACIKPLGTYLQVGIPEGSSSMTIGYFDFILKNISIYGSIVGSVNEIEQMLKFSHENQIVSINEHYSWEEFPKALDKLENGKPYFRGVVEVDSESKKYPLKK
jgi:D-arabinose 1-dehydrogenase-like Zn-dependent alcohol dehydrogenase